MLRTQLTQRLSSTRLHLASLRNLAPASRIALAILLVVCLAAVFAPLIAPYDPLTTGLSRGPAAPDAAHWFGTDRQGRDVFSRLLYGAGYSLIIGLGATAVALLAAAVLGAITATAGKWVSEMLMRGLDMIMSFPGIALAVVFVTVFGQSLPVLVLTIAFLYVPQLTRVIRANIIGQYGEDYVAAVRVMGASTPRILVRHVARNCMAPILVFATVLVADAIVFEASLSFIQAGVPDPEPSWGNVMASGRQLVMSGAWWPTLFAGILITTTVLALNILAEGMTDVMAAPRARSSVNAAAVEAAIEEIEAPKAAAPGAATAGAVVSLQQRLDSLRAVELARTDRPRYDRDEPPLLEVKNLSIAFPRHGDVDVVDTVSFYVRPGETLALVGEFWLWEIDHLAGHNGPARPQGAHRRRDPFRGPQPADHGRSAAQRPARQGHRHDLPGRPVLAQPGDADPRPDEPADRTRRHPQRRRPSRARRPRFGAHAEFLSA